MTTIQRAGAGLIAAGALGALALQTYIDITKEGDQLLAAIWSQARYFTNLMMFSVGIFFAIQFANRRLAGPGWSTALTVWIVLVGIVYHVLLSSTHHPEGGDIVVNLFQHTIVPIAALVFWLAFANKQGLTFKHPLIWLACPIGYVAFVLLRGAFDGTYPYFFLNPKDIGWPGVSAYVVGLGVLFYVSGAILVGIARVMGRGAVSEA
ncbi:hypothetical protein TA5114_02001 [Cognatishimia activa]|uniref:FAR-17a/AIG1-like protein n=1 Tax=Cognatishimia activa TaxID=1715691 RepID=A0A0P1IRS0_9RHOB|nr:Pr6Pr family membrane protein [Cognatishimia activa]CUK26194.1 hypothetical protein TA5114_02001 [Cognatishimia activa]